VAIGDMAVSSSVAVSAPQLRSYNRVIGIGPTRSSPARPCGASGPNGNE